MSKPGHLSRPQTDWRTSNSGKDFPFQTTLSYRVGGGSQSGLRYAGLLAESAVAALVLFAFPPVLNTLWYGPGFAAVPGLHHQPARPRTWAARGRRGQRFPPGANGARVGGGVRRSLMIFISFGALASALFWLARSSIREEMVS